MSGSPLSDGVLRLERLIASPPELLFELWTAPDQLVRWWAPGAPDGYQCSVDSLDATPGGRWRTILQAVDGKRATISGIFRVVDSPRRLEFTWGWEKLAGERGHETAVIVNFEPVPGGTRLVLLQRQFDSQQARDNHHRGWSSSFDRLINLAH